MVPSTPCSSAPERAAATTYPTPKQAPTTTQTARRPGPASGHIGRCACLGVAGSTISGITTTAAARWHSARRHARFSASAISLRFVLARSHPLFAVSTLSPFRSPRSPSHLFPSLPFLSSLSSLSFFAVAVGQRRGGIPRYVINLARNSMPISRSSTKTAASRKRRRSRREPDLHGVFAAYVKASR